MKFIWNYLPYIHAEMESFVVSVNANPTLVDNRFIL